MNYAKKKNKKICAAYINHVPGLSRSALSTHPFGLLLKNVIHNRSELRMDYGGSYKRR